MEQQNPLLEFITHALNLFGERPNFTAVQLGLAELATSYSAEQMREAYAFLLAEQERRYNLPTMRPLIDSYAKK